MSAAEPAETGPGSGGAPARPHLVLVGLPGAGKSTVGRAAAERLGWPFLDFDEEIERRESRSITRIFAESGEEYFRQRELELTEALRDAPGMVLSPGGGWITSARAVATLRPPARILYLRVRPEIALRRLGAERATRPLLQRPDPLAELRGLYDRRRALYETADHALDTEAYTFQQLIEKVAELASISG